jgi:hypothetical protein
MYWYIPARICTDLSRYDARPTVQVGHLDPCHPDIECRTFDIMSSVTFDIEDFDIECASYIDFLHLRYRMSISNEFDIEGLIIRYRRSQTFDIEGHEQGCPSRYRGFMPSISNIERSISHVDIVFDIEGLQVSDVRYRRSCHNISGSISYTI